MYRKKKLWDKKLKFFDRQGGRMELVQEIVPCIACGQDMDTICMGECHE